ncbi:MAG TPA: hypothetical protein VK866_06110 [Acidimicrobiales bacterium]|nr:hypothetical protein [Acidimicrobiales bacterium]
MADVTDCPGCGRRLPWGARRCRACGTSADALTGAGHSGEAPGPASGTGTVSVGGDRRGGVLAVVALVGALVVWLVATGGADGGGDDAAPAPVPDVADPDSADPDVEPVPSTAPPTASRPDPDAPATTAPARTVERSVDAEQALDVATGLAALAIQRDALVVVDLDTGARVDVPLPDGAPAEWAFLVDGTIVVPHRGGLWLLGPESTDAEPWTTVDAPGGPAVDWWPLAPDVLVMSDSDGQWAVPVHASGYGDPVALSGWSEVVGRLGDEVVVNTPDGAYALAPDGSVRRVTRGRVAGVADDLLLVRSCDDVGRCEVAVTDVGSGRVLPLMATDFDGSFVFRGAIGPSGDRALVVTQEARGDSTLWWMQTGRDPAPLGPFAGWGGPAPGMAFGADGTVAVWHDATAGRLRVAAPDGEMGSAPWRSPLVELATTIDLPSLLRQSPDTQR